MTKTKHRHLVAAPIAILAVMALAGVSMFLPVRAELGSAISTVKLSAPSGDQTFNVGGSVAGILRSGSFLTTDDLGSRLSLKSGQVLLRNSEPVIVDLGADHSVISVRGSFVAVRDPDALTIAALNASLLYTSGTSASILVAGQQVRLQTGRQEQRSSIGPDWLRSQMSDLSGMPDTEKHEIQNEDFSQTISDRDGQACSDSVLQSHLSRSDLRSALSLLLATGRITEDTYSCIRTIARTLDSTGMLYRLVLISLITEGARTDAAVSNALLKDVRNDAALHYLSLNILPDIARVYQRPLQPAFLQAFPKSLIEIGLADSARAVSILRRAASTPRALIAAGLPLQADAWKTAVTRTVVVLKTTVPESIRPDLDAIMAEVLQSAMLSPREEEPTLVASVPAQPTTQWNRDDLIAITQDVLVTHGALLAVTTELQPDTATQQVRVEGVYLLEHGKHTQYSFTYDLSTATIQNIVRDGHRLPNAVPVQNFFGE